MVKLIYVGSEKKVHDPINGVDFEKGIARQVSLDTAKARILNNPGDWKIEAEKKEVTHETKVSNKKMKYPVEGGK